MLKTHDRLGAGEFEQHPLERRQTRRVDVLDHLDDHGGVKAG
jgi:hypothetical protein